MPRNRGGRQRSGRVRPCPPAVRRRGAVPAAAAAEVRGPGRVRGTKRRTGGRRKRASSRTGRAASLRPILGQSARIRAASASGGDAARRVACAPRHPGGEAGRRHA